MWCRSLTVLAIFLLPGSFSDEDCDATRLNDVMNGLLRSLQYMDQHKTELILDGLLGIRITSDQLAILAERMAHRNFTAKHDVLLRLNYLTNMSKTIVDQSAPLLKLSQSDYIETLGNLLTPDTWKLNYPTNRVNKGLQEEPLPCGDITFEEKNSDECISRLIGGDSDAENTCEVPDECMLWITEKGTKDYELTHQTLYLQIAEMHKCGRAIESLGYSAIRIAQLQNYLCANVLRDAEDIAENGYPISHRDLFLEQIGVCAMYGFGDFWRKDWTDEILSWQNYNGCFEHSRRYKCKDDLSKNFNNRLRKRNDLRLPDGCSVHMTAVALIALAADIRFCTEAFSRSSG